METKALPPFKPLWANIALAYLAVVSILGLLLRYLFIQAVPGLVFKNILHAHSHTALLGWVHSALFIAITTLFLPEELQSKKKYRIQFWVTQLAVVGMLFSFPFQGYGPVSIAFSTLHIVVSWWFAWSFYKDTRQERKLNLPIRFVHAGLLFLSISAIGPFSLGPMMVNGMGGSQWYYLAIYFYLHFMYNGWFSLAIGGIFLKLLQNKGIAYPEKPARRFYALMAWSCVPAYLLSALWTKPAAIFYWVGGIAALMQLAALINLGKLILPLKTALKEKLSGMPYLLLQLAGLAFTLKIGMQLLTALPYFADLSYNIRNFVIGYLHLVLLGFVSLFLFAFYLANKQWEAVSAVSRNGIWMFLAGFVLSEALLFLQGILLWLNAGFIVGYTQYVFLVSILMPAGLLSFLIAQLRYSHSIQAQMNPLSLKLG